MENDYPHKKDIRMLKDSSRIEEFLSNTTVTKAAVTGTISNIPIKIYLPPRAPPKVGARSSDDLEIAYDLILDYLIKNPREDTYYG